MIIDLQGISMWILIAVLKHTTGLQPGQSVTQRMYNFMTALLEKWKRIREYTEGVARVKTQKHNNSKMNRKGEKRFHEIR